MGKSKGHKSKKGSKKGSKRASKKGSKSSKRDGSKSSKGSHKSKDSRKSSVHKHSKKDKKQEKAPADTQSETGKSDKETKKKTHTKIDKVEIKNKDIPGRDNPPEIYSRHYGKKTWPILHEWISKTIQGHPDDVLEFSYKHFKDIATEAIPPDEIRDYDEWFRTDILGIDLKDLFPKDENERGEAKVYGVEDIIEALPKPKE